MNYTLILNRAGDLRALNSEQYAMFQRNNSAATLVLRENKQVDAHAVLGKCTRIEISNIVGAAFQKHKKHKSKESENELVSVLDKLIQNQAIERETAENILQFAGLTPQEIANTSVASKGTVEIQEYVNALFNSNSIDASQIQVAFEIGIEKGLAKLKSIYPLKGDVNA